MIRERLSRRRLRQRQTPRRRWHLLEQLEDRRLLDAALSASPHPVLQGADLTLTLQGLSEPVARVDFYWDADHSDSLNTGDLLLGSDIDGNDGWSINAAMAGIPAGQQTILAQTDDGIATNVVASTAVPMESAVYWDGEGGDSNWNNPLNWTSNALPGNADAVVINAPGALTVTKSSGSTVVRRLDVDNSLSLTGGSLTVTGPSVVRGHFHVATGVSLTATGPSASFEATGTATVGASNLAASAGALLRLPITSYSGSVDGGTQLRSVGAGSRLELPQLATLSGFSRDGQVQIQAEGAVVDLGSLTNIPSGTVQVTAEGSGSEVNLAALEVWVDQNTNRASSIAVHAEGRVPLDSLVTLEGVNLAVTGGQVLTLPSLTTYRNSFDEANTLRSVGAGSQLNFPALTTVHGGGRNGWLTIEAHAGGLVDMSQVTSFQSGSIQVTSRGTDDDGTGSLVELSSLASWVDPNNSRVSSLEQIDAGNVALPALATMDGVNLQVTGGQILTLPSLTTYRNSFDETNTIKVIGAGSELRFPALTTVHGGGRNGWLTIEAHAGGLVDMSQVSSFQSGSIQVSSRGADGDGTGSLVQLSSLTSWVDPNNSRVSSLEQIDAGNVALPVLATMEGVNLQVTGGQVLTLPSLTTYRNSFDEANTVRVIGAGSELRFPALTTVHGGGRNGWLTIEAHAGGLVDMSQVTSFQSGSIQVSSRGEDGAGTGSLVELSSLTSWVDPNNSRVSSLEEVDGGVVALPVLTTMDGVNLQVTGGQVLSLPSLTTYRNSFDEANTLRVIGAGSELRFPALTAVHGGGRNGWLTIEAHAGGLVDMSGVTSFESGSVQISSRGTDGTGTGSRVQLSSLTNWVDPNNSRVSSLDELDGGTVALPALQTMDGVNLQVTGGQVLTLPSLTTFRNSFDEVNTVRAIGAGSELRFPALTAVHGGGRNGWLTIEAHAGGLVDMSQVTSFQTGSTQVSSRGTDGTGTGSLVQLSSLTSWVDPNNSRVSSLDEVDGGTVALPVLATMDGVNLQVTGGQVLTLPSLTTYRNSFDEVNTVRAIGAGSELRFPVLTSVHGGGRNGWLTIEAHAGGLIDMSGVTSFESGSIQVSSRGEDGVGNGSLVQLSSLTSWLDPNSSRVSSLDEVDGGTVALPVLTTMDGVNLQVTGGQVLTLPSLTTYRNSFDEANTLRAIGAGSQLRFPMLTAVHGGGRNGWLTIEAHAGGLIDMSGVTSIPSGAVQVTARGEDESAAASRVDLSSLSTFTDTNGGRLSSVRADGHGVIELSSGTTSVASVDVELYPSGSLQVGTLELLSGSRLLGSGVLAGNLLNSTGQILVGHGIGSINVTGEYTQGANGILRVDLEGSTAGASYDQLVVGGQANLNGTLDVITAGFEPQIADEFAVITFASATGDFSNKTGIDVAGTAAYSAAPASTEYRLETLDPSPLVTVVHWDGGGGDSNWNNPNNWDTNTVPTAAQHVVIDVAGDLTVTLSSANVTVKSLQSEEGLTISGGTFTVTGPAIINGTLTTNNTSIFSTGSRAAFVVNGATNMAGTNLYAREGGSIDLPNVASLSYGGTDYVIEAVDDGSTVHLGVTNLLGSTAGGRYLYVRAGSGGEVQFPQLVSASRRVQFQLQDATGAITVPALESLGFIASLQSELGAELVLPSVTTAVDAGNLLAYTGSRISLPLLTSYTADGDNFYFQAYNHSTIDLPLLSDLQGSTAGGRWLFVQAERGGQILMPELDAAGRRVQLTALDSTATLHVPQLTSLGLFASLRAEYGADLVLPSVTTAVDAGNVLAYTGSRISLPQLTSYAADGDNFSMLATDHSTIEMPLLSDLLGSTAGGRWLFVQAERGGQILLPELDTAGRRVQLTLSDSTGTVDVPQLASLGLFASLRAEYGANLVLPSVTTAVDAGNVLAYTGSRIYLPQLTSYAADGDNFSMVATDHGTIDMPLLSDLLGSTAGGRWLFVQAERGGQILLPELDTAGRRVQLTLLDSTATIQVPLLTSLGLFASLRAEYGANLVLPSVTTAVDAGNVLAYSGSRISLPQLTSYAADGENFSMLATDHSTIEMPLLSDLQGSTAGGRWLFVQAERGGQVLLPELDTASRRVQLALLDSTATVHVPQLASLGLFASLRAEYGANLVLPSVTIAVDAGNVLAYTGSRISLPQLTSYAADGDNFSMLATDHSTIDMPMLSDLQGSTAGGRWLFVQAERGGQVLLPELDTASRRIQLALPDSTGTIAVPQLAALGFFASLRAEYGANLVLPSVTTAVDAGNVLAYTGSRIYLPQLTSYAADGDNFYFQAYDHASIEMPLLNDLQGSTSGGRFLFILAATGGTISLPELNSISRRVSVQVLDSTAAAEMPNVTTLTTLIDLRAEKGGVLSLPEVLTAAGGGNYLAIDQGQILLPKVTTIGGFSDNRWYQSIGDGSRLEMPGVASLGGSTAGGRYLFLDALDGGVLQLGTTSTDLGNLQRITTTSASQVSAGNLVVSLGADLTATGTIAGDLLNHGQLRVAPGLGILDILGRFVQADTATLSMDLSGTVPGSLHDQLNVAGLAVLAGTLNVSRGGYAPSAGDTFDILRYSSRSCDFDTKLGLDLGGGSFLAASFSDSTMQLEAGSVPDSGRQCADFPEFTNISIGPDPAKANDPLSITFELDEPLVAHPTVLVDGQAASFVSHVGTIFTYTYLVSGQETEGLVDVEFTATNLDGGVGSAFETVAFDFTPPAILNLAASPEPVNVGQTLNVTFTGSEPLSTNTLVTIGGQPAVLQSVAGLNYTYRRVIDGSEGSGELAIDVVALDIAGNIGSGEGTVEVLGGVLSIEPGSIIFSNDHPVVGETVTGVVTVRNQGAFPASNVPVRLTLFEPGVGERLLGTPTIATLPANGQGIVSVNFPVQTSGVLVLQAHVDPDEQLADVTRLDNVATRSLLAGAVSGEVILVSSTLTPTSGFPGSLVTLTGTAFYNSALNPAGPVAAGEVTVQVPGTAISITTATQADGGFHVDFAMPSLPGEYIANSLVTDVTTSGSDADLFTVLAPPFGIDLFTRGEYITFSETSPLPGQAITISARVFNVGGADFTGTTEVSFLEGATLLGVAPLTDLAAGQSKVVSIMHSFATSGPHTIRVLVDPNGDVSELQEGNNSGTRTIQVLTADADLAPIAISYSDDTPSTIQPIVVTATIANSGGSEAQSVEVQFFDGANLLDTRIVPTIAAQGSASVAITTTLSAAGSHNLRVVVDPQDAIVEADETNNTLTRNILVHAPAPDLAPSAITLSNSSPQTGEVINVAVTVRNQGEVAGGSFRVQFKQDADTIHIATVAGLLVGETATLSINTSFSSAGPHSLSVLVDLDDDVAELSEVNNTVTRSLTVLATPLPDLTLSAGDFAISNLNPTNGETVTVSVPLRNVGSALASNVSAQLFIDGVVTDTTTPVPADIVAAGSGTASFSFAANQSDGFHLLEIVADPSNTIGEVNENNNRAFVLILVGDYPDLLVSQISFSNETPIEGDVISINATVLNDGRAAASEVTVRFFDGAEQIGEVSSLAFPVGDTQVVSVPFDTAGRAGNRTIRIIVDPNNEITESNEGNNLVSTVLDVQRQDPLPPLTSGSVSPAPNSAGWNNSNVTVTLLAADNVGGSGVNRIVYAVDGGPATIAFADNVQIPIISEGIHAISYYAVDNDQNAEAPQTMTVRLDKTAPLPAHNGPALVVLGGSGLLNGTASSDALSGVASTAWALDGDNLFDDGDPATFHATNLGSFAVVLQVTDAAGNVAQAATDVEVIPPAQITGRKFNDLDRDGVRDADEPGLDGWTIYLDGNGNEVLDNGESSTVTSGGGLYTLGGLLPGNYIVREVSQADWEQTAPASGQHVVTVGIGEIAIDRDFGNVLRNQPPVADAGGPYLVLEGGSLQLSGADSTDVDQDPATLNYQWDLDGDGLFGESGLDALRGDELGMTPFYSAVGLDGPDSRLVRLRVTDAGLLVSEADATIEIANAPPSISDITFDRNPINEGDTVAVTGSFADGALGVLGESFSGTALWSDGVSTPLSIHAASGTFSSVRTFADDLTTSLTVSITIHDDDGGSASSASGPLTVYGVAAELVNVAVTPEIDEDGVVTLTGEIVNPGILDSFTLDVNWGDPLSPNNVEQYVFSPGTTTFSLTHQYLDDNPSGTPQDTYSIDLQLQDDDPNPRIVEPLSWWPGEGNADDIVADNDGTLEGDTAFVPGQVGEAFRFDGPADRVTGTLTGFAGGNSPITIAAWFNETSVFDRPGKGIIGVGNTGGRQHFFLRLSGYTNPSCLSCVGSSDGLNRLFIGADDGSLDRWWGSTSIVTAGEWHHAAATFDPATNDVRLYLDGILERTITLSTGLNLTNSFFLGGDAYNDNFFVGQVDEALVYTRVLSAAEVQALASNVPATQTTSQIDTLVRNVRPEFEAGGSETLLPAQAGVFSRSGLTFSDPGDDVWSGTVNFGEPGGVAEPLVINQATKSFDLSHNYTTQGTFTVTVTVADDDLGSYTDTFEVTAILNQPPAIDDQSFDIPENSDVGTAIGIAAATDPDLPDDELQWSITNGNDSGTFTINPNTGEIFVADKATLDFETTPVFHLTIQVQDQYGETDDAVITIHLLDRQASVSIAGTDLPEGNSGSSALSFVVTVSGDAVNVPFSLNYQTQDGTATTSTGSVGGGDYDAASGLLTFDGSTGSAQTVSVTINGDEVVELNEGFSVLLSGLTGTNDVVLANDTGLGTIQNDDAATLSIGDVTQTETDGSIVFHVDLLMTGLVDSTVSVGFSTADGTATAGPGAGGNDYQEAAETATILAGFAAAVIDTTVNGDDLAESDEQFFLNLLVSTLSAGGRAVTVAKAQSELTILNDDFAPAADAGGPYTIREGDPLTLNASGSTDDDTSSAALAYLWDVDGDGDFDETVTGANPTLSSAQLLALGLADGPDSRTVTVEVSDGSNRHTAQTTLSIDNQPPVITVSQAQVTVDEGSAAGNSGTFSDPGIDLVTLSASVGTIVDLGAGNWSWSYDAADGPSDSQLVTITATDSDNGASSIAFALTVNNVAPSLAPIGPQVAAQGVALTLADLIVTDDGYRNLAAGTDETFTFVIEWGDATTSSGTVDIDVVGSSGIATLGSFDASHTYALPGDYEVVVTVTDDDGDSDTQTIQVAVERSIIVLHPGISGALDVSGNGIINIPGSLFVNSNHVKALTARGNASVSADNVQVVGGVSTVGNATVSPTPVTGTAPLLDPLLGLPVPADDIHRGSVECSGNAHETLLPGVYTKIQASGNCELTLTSGTYILAGGQFQVTGNAVVVGEEVFIYQAGSNFPDPGGSFEDIQLNSSGPSSLTPPASGPYRGILIFQARENTQRITLNGLGLAGTIYAPAAQVQLSGNSSIQLALIVDRLNISGNASSTLLGVEQPDEDSQAPVWAVGQLLSSVIEVSLQDVAGTISAQQRARLSDAIAVLNAAFADFGLQLVEVDASEYLFADVRIDVAASSPCGDASAGVLGCTTSDGDVTLLAGWNWYDGADETQIASGQYDFQTILTHELGHAIGLEHSGDAQSVMHNTLEAGQTRRQLADADLALLEYDEEHDEEHGHEAEALRAVVEVSPDGFQQADFVAVLMDDRLLDDDRRSAGQVDSYFSRYLEDKSLPRLLSSPAQLPPPTDRLSPWGAGPRPAAVDRVFAEPTEDAGGADDEDLLLGESAELWYQHSTGSVRVAQV